MPIPDDIRELIKHALVWAWKDEEMHAIYIRGALFKLGSWPLRTRAFARQVAGAVGGWSASIQQHVPWSTVPVSRAAAALLTSLGSLSGKIPRDVKHSRIWQFVAASSLPTSPSSCPLPANVAAC